jgi:hypothetical protein
MAVTAASPATSWPPFKVPAMAARTESTTWLYGLTAALGQVSIAHAFGDGSVSVAGRSDLRRRFGGWIGLSPFASPRA